MEIPAGVMEKCLERSDHRNSKKRLSRKIKQIVRTDEKSKEEDAEDEDSDDVDGATSKGFLIFCFLILM